MQSNKLRAKMAEKGFTQRSLANEINMSENAFSLKMTGRSTFDILEAENICRVLHIDNPSDKADIFLS